MKISTIMVLLGMVFAATPAWAAPTSYTLDIRGVKCAFCAYNVAGQLTQLPGVQPQSVQVDVAAGTARLISDEPLAQEMLAQALEQAGFRLAGVESSPATADKEGAHAQLRTVMRVEIDLSETEEKVFGPVLKTLGAAIAEHGGQVRLEAPGAMEKMLVKSLLMGKRIAIPVHFESRNSRDDAVLEWQQSTAQ